MKQLVENWMTKHPLKVDVNEDVECVAEIMRDEAIGHMVATDQGELAGVLSTKDLKMVEKIRAKFDGLDCLNVKITVGDLMGRHPTTIFAEETMSDAIRLMNDKGFHALPVQDESGKLIGILTSTDVMRYALVASHQFQVGVPFEKLTKILR